jgi:hypothetical protein
LFSLNFGMFPLDLRKLNFAHPYGVMIPQARVEGLLEARARELGAEIRYGGLLFVPAHRTEVIPAAP